MLYATGGAAVGNITATAAGTVPAIPATGSTSQSNTELGWTAGAGVEVGFYGNWTAKAEYLFIDLGSSTFALTGTSNGLTANMLRAGVNYHF